MLIGTFVSVLITLLVIGVQIGIALGITGIVLMFIQGNIPFDIISQNIMKSITNYAFTAIPFFILAGNLIMHGPVLTSIVNFASKLFKRVTGGLGIATMAVSTFFGAISGSSVASAAALGGSTTKALESKYPKRFVAGMVASGGTIGLMIPPSLSFIVIGGIVGLPILDLFKAGLFVGILEGVMLMVTIYLLCKIKKWDIAGQAEKETPKEYFRSLGKHAWESWAILLMPVLILGGIFLGIFTPTEIAAVSAIYALIIVTWVYRVVTGKQLLEIIQNTIYQSGMIYLIIIGGNLVAFMVTRLGFSQLLVDAFTGMNLSAWQFLLIVNLLLLFLGCFLDGTSVILLTAPLLFPLAEHFGINPIHFAVIVTANIEIGTLTPPVGLNLFVMSGVSKIPLLEVAKGTLPFYVTMILFLLIVTYFPELSLIFEK